MQLSGNFRLNENTSGNVHSFFPNKTHMCVKNAKEKNTKSLKYIFLKGYDASKRYKMLLPTCHKCYWCCKYCDNIFFSDTFFFSLIDFIFITRNAPVTQIMRKNKLKKSGGWGNAHAHVIHVNYIQIFMIRINQFIELKYIVKFII